MSSGRKREMMEIMLLRHVKKGHSQLEIFLMLLQEWHSLLICFCLDKVLVENRLIGNIIVCLMKQSKPMSALK